MAISIDESRPWGAENGVRKKLWSGALEGADLHEVSKLIIQELDSKSYASIEWSEEPGWDTRPMVRMDQMLVNTATGEGPCPVDKDGLSLSIFDTYGIHSLHSGMQVWMAIWEDKVVYKWLGGQDRIHWWWRMMISEGKYYAMDET